MANFLKREDDAYSITVRLSSSSHFPNLLGPGEDRNPDLCLRRGVDFLRLVPLFTLIASHEPIRVLYGKEVSDLNGTRIRINVLRINDLRSTLTSIRCIKLYINTTE
jgi:hypothetical protein